MVQYITTPWRARSSLLSVRAALYPSPSSPLTPEETATNRIEAIARVSIWAQRGNCPHLVESTALLCAAIVNDDPRNGTWCVRAAYASSFSRFVTGLLDSHQTSKRKISMYALAKTLNLPATYVELRHQATHEELPSLQNLRAAARNALQWIWDRYWADLSSTDPDEAEQGEVGEEKVLGVLVDVQEGGEEDREAILRAVRLSRRALGGEGNLNPEVEEGERGSIEDIRRELERAKEDLHEEVNEGGETGVHMHVTDDEGKGWAMWEGPWIPTPIGTVRC